MSIWKNSPQTDKREHRKLTQTEKFWKNVSIKTENECWLWVGKVNHDGYGKFWWNGKNDSAHRISYMLHYGKIPEDKEICHTCDKPRCVNPNHLEAKTHAKNMNDTKLRNRRNVEINLTMTRKTK